MKRYLKYILLILTFGIFQSICSQETKIGIVKYVKNIDTKNKYTQSTTDSTIAYFNKRKHSILIFNKNDSIQLQTDSIGEFLIPKKYFEFCSIIVNPEINYLRKDFLFTEGFGRKDSLYFEINDYHISNKIDSTQVPEFYNNYNIQKAELDFYKGKKRYLLGNGITYSIEFIEKLELMSKKFGFKIEYPEKMKEVLAEHRILYKYNERMRELIGIENSW